ncbi:hypothetical protein B0H14DRAFT_3669588 [Mycena olivaceomarginata]|nr:hypothetical protein B0H14DRAFT_3669588 [Mycena olivaceomarginata]
MNHARSSGASVYEQTKVTSISFSSVDPKRRLCILVPRPTPDPPLSSGLSDHVYYAHIPQQASARIGCCYRYHNNRHFNSSLKNVACWGYWSGAGIYGGDESGWAWFIPLASGRTSVGVVMNQKIYNDKMKQPAEPTYFLPSSIPNPTESIMVNRYLCNILLAPGVAKLLGVAVMEVGSVKSATDFSYSTPSYTDCGYRIIGDAGAFHQIDPFFSSGVHLALTSALSTASTICASIRGDCTESIAADWHTKRVSTSYTRFQVVVLSAYMQIRNSQSADVLSDIDENNFDRAFSFLRPVIQGASDMGKLLSQTELQKSLDFCVNLFNPTTPEQHDRVAGKPEISQALLDVAAPLVDPTVLEKPSITLRLSKRDCSASEVAETRMVLHKINARRVVHAEYAVNNLESEPIAGHVVRLEKGCLGLTRLSVCTTPERAD